MRYAPALLLLALAGASFYLSAIDRSSIYALSLVELEGSLGVPLWPVFAGLGAVFIVLGVLGRPQRTSSGAPSTVRAGTRGPRAPGVGAGGDWRRVVEGRIQGAVFEDGARVELTNQDTVPFVLHLTRLTPERSRRALQAFAELVSGLPTPPRVRVSFLDVSEEGAPRHHLVAGVFAKFYERQAFRCIRGGESVDVIFQDPDKRWTGG